MLRSLGLVTLALAVFSRGVDLPTRPSKDKDSTKGDPMKHATILVLLAVMTMAGSLTAEVSAPKAAVTIPALSQAAPPQPFSAASTPEIQAHLPFRYASVCGPAYRTVINYWGFEGTTGNDSCPVVCGGCYTILTTNKLVGQLIFECDGTTTQWGLSCDDFYTITDDPCPICEPEEY